jgi:hypothetical protein
MRRNCKGFLCGCAALLAMFAMGGPASAAGYGSHHTADPGAAHGSQVVYDGSGMHAMVVGNAVTNGGFETNGGAGTSILNGWTVVTDNCGSPGSWYAQTGTSNPLGSSGSNTTVAAPPEGSFAAMSDQDGPGTRAMYQDITIPADATNITFQLYLLVQVEDWVTPNPQTLQTCDSVGNEQFRADIITTSSDPTTEIDSGVLLTIYQTMPSDALESGYTEVQADISSLAGQTVRLRFVEADNEGNLNAGVDDVMITGTVPDLGAYGMAILALLLLAAGVSVLLQRRRVA